MSFIVGEELPPLQVQITRDRLVRYAGASLDFNPIHWNERFAKQVGLPDVIAHGMFTMAEAIRIVTDWIGDPGAVVEYGVRFTRPVVVPDDGVGASELEAYGAGIGAGGDDEIEFRGGPGAVEGEVDARIDTAIDDAAVHRHVAAPATGVRAVEIVSLAG